LATTLGQNRSGEARFSGILGSPVILNEMLVDDDSSDAWLGNSLSTLRAADCERVVAGEF
ncbi:hypothetical protein N8739_12570, partial [Luminiphilus sp.]|nr:hypothetical protein [Luminiphilus sp.]